MPTYEFKCETCSTDTTDRIYEAKVSLDELDVDIPCPECNNVLKRIDFYAVPWRFN